MTQRRPKTFGRWYRWRAQVRIAIAEFVHDHSGGLGGVPRSDEGAISSLVRRRPAPLGSLDDASTWQARALISAVLIVVDLAALIMTVGHLDGPARVLVGLILGAVIPGWSIIGPLRLGNPAMEIGLAVSVSFASLMIVAQILMSVHAWHLTVLEEVTCVVCLPSLIWQSRGVVLLKKQWHG